MKLLKQLFHFLGGISCAIALIACAACTVIIGTFLESSTGSHQWAAQWTYEHPGFLLLLSLFFINILFSALRRWPFKRRHIPFLITHLGLLMVIGGTIIKNRYGIQGNLSVWEGSGNHNLLLPHSHALYIEKNEDTSVPNTRTVIALDSLHRSVYYPPLFPDLKCKIIGSAPHVKQKFETWIKGTKLYIRGLPPIDLEQWDENDPLPKGIITHLSMQNPQRWHLLALSSANIPQTIRKIYFEGLILKLVDKHDPGSSFEIPLQDALTKPFDYAGGEWVVACDLVHSIQEQNYTPSFNLTFQPHDQKKGEMGSQFTLIMKGENAFTLKGTSKWREPFFTMDLIRPLPLLCVLKDGQEGTFICACDEHGRLHHEHFNPSQLHSLYSYDEGFGGYTVQAVIPAPSFPAARQDKETARKWELTKQLKEALDAQPSLTPPLQCLKKACDKVQLDFPAEFVRFLFEWNGSPYLLFEPTSTISPSLAKALQAIEWGEVSEDDRKASGWVVHLFNQLDTSTQQGGDYLTALKKHQWPLLDDLKEAIKGSEEPIASISWLNKFSRSSSYLPPLNTLDKPLSVNDSARMLSAFFRIYGIDYRSLNPYKNEDKETFETLAHYWKENQSDQKFSLDKEILLETPLTTRIIPAESPLKLEIVVPESC